MFAFLSNSSYYLFNKELFIYLTNVMDRLDEARVAKTFWRPSFLSAGKLLLLIASFSVNKNSCHFLQVNEDSLRSILTPLLLFWLPVVSKRLKIMTPPVVNKKTCPHWFSSFSGNFGSKFSAIFARHTYLVEPLILAREWVRLKRLHDQTF